MRKTIAIVMILVSAAAIVAGIFRKEIKPLYANAMAICYSCIGLE